MAPKSGVEFWKLTLIRACEADLNHQLCFAVIRRAGYKFHRCWFILPHFLISNVLTQGGSCALHIFMHSSPDAPIFSHFSYLCFPPTLHNNIILVFTQIMNSSLGGARTPYLYGVNHHWGKVTKSMDTFCGPFSICCISAVQPIKGSKGSRARLKDTSQLPGPQPVLQNSENRDNQGRPASNMQISWTLVLQLSCLTMAITSVQGFSQV